LSFIKSKHLNYFEESACMKNQSINAIKNLDINKIDTLLDDCKLPLKPNCLKVE